MSFIADLFFFRRFFLPLLLGVSLALPLGWAQAPVPQTEAQQAGETVETSQLPPIENEANENEANENDTNRRLPRLNGVSTDNSAQERLPHTIAPQTGYPFADRETRQLEKNPFYYELSRWWSSALALSAHRTVITPNFFTSRLASHHLALYLSEVYDYSVYQLYASGDFSQSEAHVFSLLGASWTWNRYGYNEHDISDKFFAGKMLHPLETTHHTLAIDALHYRLDLFPHYGNFVHFKVLTAPVGPAVPYWKIVNQIYNHQASQLRDPPPTTARRSQPVAFELENQTTHALKNFAGDTIGMISSDFLFNYQKRSLLQFDAKGYQKKFNDDNISSTGILEAIFFKNANLGLKHSTFTAMFTVANQQHLNATAYFLEEETAKYTGLAFSFFYKRRPYGWQVPLGEQVGLSIEQKKIEVRDLQKDYNILRISGGEGLYPFYPSIQALLLTPKFHFNYSLISALGESGKAPILGALALPMPKKLLQTRQRQSSSPLLKQEDGDALSAEYREDDLAVSFSAANTLAMVEPLTSRWRKAVYYLYDNSGLRDFRSLYEMHFLAKPFNYALIENSAGFSINEREKQGLRFFGAIGLDVLGAVTSTTSVVLPSLYFRAGMQILLPSLVNFRLEMGRKNIPFTTDFALFVSPDYLSAENYVWNDDGDEEFSTDELSNTLHSTTGGKYRSVDSSLKQPHLYYISMPLAFLLPKNVVFSLSINYSIFKQQLWVEYDGDLDDYGHFETFQGEIDGEVVDKRVFVQHNGEKRYKVVNLDENLFPSPTPFSDSPFYTGGTLKLSATGKRYFFSLSFTAYIVNGITRHGNGFRHNSLGILEESMAIPQERRVGRLDSDRGYLGRMLIAYQFHKTFLASFSLSYRDGQPFGVWSSYPSQEGDAQHINWVRDKVSGDNILLYNGEFGQREDAIWNFDVRLLFLPPLPKNKGRLELYLAAYNLLDLALEVLEYSSYADKIKERAALETQHPRSLELGFRYFY